MKAAGKKYRALLYHDPARMAPDTRTMTDDELAAMFQMEKNNVSVRLHRIRLRLQAEMER